MRLTDAFASVALVWIRPCDLLIPEANIHTVKRNERSVRNQMNKKHKKSRRETTNWRPLHGVQCPTLIPVAMPVKSRSSASGIKEIHTPFYVFVEIMNMGHLVNLIFEESNLYAQQNGREFLTNEDVMAFLEINCIMSTNLLPTIQSYWECGQFIGNEGIQNVMTRARFKDILKNLHFSYKVHFK